ncbi:MAG TPA: hypothetical protein PKN44_07990 [Bacteroidales bacterium]|nr:hypothetical protein [Bacteroidales bacterium]HPS51613.1 hypothetical protein [Bacteroidales bacterium]
MNEQSGLFTPGGHLNDEACAMWVDALNEGREHELPVELKLHTDTCLSCKQRILTIHRLTNTSINHTHHRTPNHAFFALPVITRNHYLVAAVLLILLVVGISLIYMFSGRNKNQQNLFTEYFTPYPDILTVKSGQGLTSHDSLFQAGLIVYSDANYDTAISIFTKLNALNPKDDTLGFYLANSLLASGKDPGIAIQLLEFVIRGGSPFACPAQWYLALAWIRMDKRTEAADVLQKIVATPNPYQGKATELLKAIN